MQVVHSAAYQLDLGGHVFPTLKYQLVRSSLLSRGVVRPEDVVDPVAATWDELALVHAWEYLDKVRHGRLTPKELAELELPLTPDVVEGFRLMAGGTVRAARLALDAGLAGHLGGGFHHAFANHGEGFCLFNDVAVAVRVLQREGLAQRVAVVDCDVHHGNGTAMIFERDDTVFTFSIHQQHNYPLFKPRGSLDIGLADGTNDAEYLEHLPGALSQVLESAPDVLFYLAGADPFREDQLGGLGLTHAGLRQRDRMVLQACREAGLPVAIALAGGYATRIEDIVSIHVATIEEAVAVQREAARGSRGRSGG